ncbi:MAG TPA: DNA repair protein RadC [Symbiobacteriaceae bacterium]|jgi:DNA repair protein RadC
MSVPLKALPQADRPREKLVRLGAERLSDVELVAILLGTGVKGRSVIELAQALLHHCESKSTGNGLRGLLELRDIELKQAVPGIGQAKLCQVLAALQLGLRAGATVLKRVDLSNPRTVFEYLAPRMSSLDHEQFMVILLNAKNHVIDVECVSVGTLTASLVHPREIFKSAIRRSAHAIIVAHNHPSGDPTPSREDREVTQRLVQAGRLIGIEVLDHLVVGDGRYISFRERKLLEWP